VVLWAAALVIMLAAAAWQRQTGPSHSKDGEAVVAGRTVSYRFHRSGISGEPFRVSIPAPAEVSGNVRWRRYPVEEPFGTLTMVRDDGELFALLPTQPPAGKLEYSLLLVGPDGVNRLPEDGPIVMRFRGHVPLVVLVPHISIVFLAMLVGVRTALGALWARPETFRLAQATLAGITLGGMILGPIVQKFAFGAFWTGWPFGRDLTDNKTVVLWLAWLVAVLTARATKDVTDRFARTMVVAAAIVMLVVYLVPHSLRGSQLDYEKLDSGKSASGSVTTGR
jgi:hypothetical protein